LFDPEDDRDLGKAEGSPALTAKIRLMINGLILDQVVPVQYIWRIPSYGEKRRDLICVPDFTASFDQKITILKENQEKTIKFKVHSFKDSLKDEIKIKAPEGWEITPASIPLDMKSKHDEQWVEFKLTPLKRTISVDFKSRQPTLFI